MPCQGTSKAGLPLGRERRLPGYMTHRLLAALATSLILIGITGYLLNTHPTTVATIELSNSATAARFGQRLPEVLLFNDRMGTAEISRLGEPLAVGSVGSADAYRAGDVAYWAPERTVVVFLTDTSAVPDTGLVRLGRVVAGLDGLAECNRNCPVQFTIGGGQ